MTDQSSVSHRPQSEQWQFDQSVSECFPDMARRSIPLYEQTITELVQMSGRILGRAPESWVEIGAARGRVVMEAINHYGDDKQYVLIEPSQSMFDLLNKEQRLNNTIKTTESALVALSNMADKSVDVISCLWTLQFCKLDERALILRECRRVIRDDGVLLFAEKVSGQTPRFAELLQARYEDWKFERGYSRDSIAAKKKSLEGVLVTRSAPQNKALVNDAGFDMEEVLRFYNFAAWICLPR